MAVSEPGGDPRVGAPPPEPASEASVRPVVALPRGGPSGLAFGIAAIVAGAILFSVLEARRQSLTPSVRHPAADAAQPAPPPPPLYVPPPPAPLPVVQMVERNAPAPEPRPV